MIKKHVMWIAMVMSMILLTITAIVWGFGETEGFDTTSPEVMPFTVDGQIPMGYMVNAENTNLVRIPKGFEISPNDSQKMVPIQNQETTQTPLAITLGDTQIYQTNNGASNFRYSHDNLDFTYHREIPDNSIYDTSMNYVKVKDPSGNTSWIPRAPPQAPPFYYDIEAPKYNPSLFVPTYEESRILSHVRKTPQEGKTVGVDSSQAICDKSGLCYVRVGATEGNK